jgi:hypothetical protein
MSKETVINASNELPVTTNRGYWGYQEINEIDQTKVAGAGDGDGDGDGCGCGSAASAEGDGGDNSAEPVSNDVSTEPDVGPIWGEAYIW